MESKDIDLTTGQLNDFLSHYFHYYNTLNPHFKSVFIERIIQFINSKKFVAHKNVLVDNRVKAIISAAAIQLTLGLEDWELQHFNTILVFPNDFTNQTSGLKLKGETGISGYVSFNWGVFVEGYKTKDDNLNLGLHEFTHALKLNSIFQDCKDTCFKDYYYNWESVAKEEMARLKEGNNGFFRAYGANNINEFLSVVVEHFFESPSEFQKLMPGLYESTAQLLNQKTDGKTTEVGIRKQ